MESLFVGRYEERAMLKRKLTSKEAEFIAIYGRRRVGKTSLIKESIEETTSPSFEMTGLKDGNLASQLEIFLRAFLKAFNPPFDVAIPRSWMHAFEMLTKAIDHQSDKKAFVVFLDELPWLATPKSGLLQALDHFWNTEWVNRKNFKLIVCGSAASWILDNIVNAKGGLHNRLTMSILLRPFHFKESLEFLSKRSIKMNPIQVLELYLVMGGVPFYLKSIEKGMSVTQLINQLCFTANGLLYSEFERLFNSLFNHSTAYLQIIRTIAKYAYGIDQNTLKAALRLSSTGGTLTKRLSELEAAGFIISFVPYGREKKGTYYRIIDEYTLFYLRWIEPVANRIKLATSQANYWQSKSHSGQWNQWIGYAFEAFCYKHIDPIAKALKIHAGFEIGTWRYLPKSKNERGVQIDLLLDRDDGVINIIEIKYAPKLFRITKQYATELGDKIDIFKSHVKTTKDIHLTMVTSNGLLSNAYVDELVANQVTLEDLLR